MRKRLRRFWVWASWPLVKAWWRLLCFVGSHEWELAPALDAQAEPVPSKKGRYWRCRRPACRAMRGNLALVAFGKWLESDDFMVLVRADCPRCYGRGYTGKMLLADGAKAKVPCGCMRLQPMFIEVPRKDLDPKALPESAERRARLRTPGRFKDACDAAFTGTRKLEAERRSA